MKNRLLLTGVVVFLIFIVGLSLWVFLDSLVYSDKIKHETYTWAEIEDSKGDIIAVETAESIVWHNLVDLRKNQTEMWIGGIVEHYDNYWGFRFRPDTIVIAEITIEGAQSNIQGISKDVNYWISIWAKETYVLSKVIEINQ